MSMLTLTGQVMNVFATPAGVGKDGQPYPASSKVQIMAENELKNGDKRIELLTMSTETPHEFESLVGRSVRVPVGVFVSGNTPAFYIVKTGRVEAL